MTANTDRRMRRGEYLRWGLGTLLLAGSLVLGVGGLFSTAQAERGDSEREDDREHSERTEGRDWAVRSWGLDRPKDPGGAALYEQECGACHLAYPPRLLPARSWQALMAGLEDHFGENAELLPADRERLERFLLAQAAGQETSLASARTLAGVDRSLPLRITELPYFKREHDEIAASLVGPGTQVPSFSRCEACHQSAAKGHFDEDQVVIPGYGRWDD